MKAGTWKAKINFVSDFRGRHRNSKGISISLILSRFVTL